MEHLVKVTSARRQSAGRWVGQGTYFADYRGERIGEFRVPECDAARWLLAGGRAARDDLLVTIRDGVPAMSGLVGWFADRTVEENEKTSPRWVKYRAFDLKPSDSASPVCGRIQDGQDEVSPLMAEAEANAPIFESSRSFFVHPQPLSSCHDSIARRHPHARIPRRPGVGARLALRFEGRKRVHNADEIMSEIVARRLVEHLERAGFVVMKRPAIGGGGVGPRVRE